MKKSGTHATGAVQKLIKCLKKGNDTSLDFECDDFEEYKPKPYKEEDTRCDNCEYLSKCMKECDYIDCTISQDTRKHIIVGNSYCYKKKGAV